MRTYELAIVADPRLSDDEFTSLVDETKQLITSRGGEVVREESWGKRKLAYPIRKLNEGRYTFLYLQMEAAKASLFPEVELRLNQNEKVLRYLTVRTDLDLKRAANRAKPGEPVRTIHSEPDAVPESESAAKPSAESAAKASSEPGSQPPSEPAAEPSSEASTESAGESAPKES
jgi:small subunit ribosomal protein S6